MKLTAKQLKALPDSEFGLVKDGKRSYPLVDKNHVRSAIAFFKYAKPEDRTELAKNINRKAKEFNMKIKAGGLFVRYIDPKVSKYDTSDTYITDASHIGTLAPIVGANPSTASNPKEAEEIINVFNDSSLFPKNKEPVQERFTVKNYRQGLMNHPLYNSNTNKARFLLNKPEFIDFDETLRRMVVEYELDEFKKYMTTNCDGSYRSIQTICDSNTTEKIHALLDNYKQKDYNVLLAQITSLILSKLDKNRMLACLAIIYFKAPELVENVIIKLKKYHGIYGEVFSQSSYEREMEVAALTGFIPKLSKGMTNDEHALLEHLCVNSFSELSMVVDLFTKSIKKKYMIVEPSINVSDYYKLQNWYNDNLIDGYYCYEIKHDITDVSFVKAKKCIWLAKPCTVLEGEYCYMSLAVMKIGLVMNLDDIPVHIFEMYMKLKSSDYSNIELIKGGKSFYQSKLNECDFTTEGVIRSTKNFMNGLHMDDEGNVKLNLTDKLSFEHYEEIHKMIKVAYDSENYDEVKRLLAYIFSIIATIEREYMNDGKGTNKKYINKQNPTYKEMVRLRSLYISDFKVYMRKIVTKEPGFKFLEYYNNSSVNSSVYTVNTSDVKKLAVLFRMAMV